MQAITLTDTFRQTESEYPPRPACEHSGKNNILNPTLVISPRLRDPVRYSRIL